MRNTIRSQHIVTEEELKNIKDLDWNSYYRESAPADCQGLSTCPDCGAILVVRDAGERTECYRCGRKTCPDTAQEPPKG